MQMFVLIFLSNVGLRNTKYHLLCVLIYMPKTNAVNHGLRLRANKHDNRLSASPELLLELKWRI